MREGQGEGYCPVIRTEELTHAEEGCPPPDPQILLLEIAVLLWLFVERPTTVLLVRHAEKSKIPENNPSLTPEGAARAAELVHVVENAGVHAIYTSDLRRTQETAAPAATLLGLVLVVGHSNTVPEIIHALGGDTVSIADDDFDNLYVVMRRWPGRVSTVHLQYGAARP